MKKRKTRIFLWKLCLVLGVMMLVFFITMQRAEEGAYCIPAYDKVSFEEVWQGEKPLSERDYDLLYHQTGLGRSALESVDWNGQTRQELREAQQRLFSVPRYQCMCDNGIVRREQTVNEYGMIIRRNHLDYIEDGDILITSASHIGGWRNGHAAIVIDACRGETLEAITLGQTSAWRTIAKWEKYPNVMVLRLKGVEEQQRAEIARWAKANLWDQPYRITAGIGNREGTQCAHLVWRAYAEFGYDLDSNKGMIVTPKQLAHSSLLEIVQVCGWDPDLLWR